MVKKVFVVSTAFTLGFVAHGLLGVAQAKPAAESPYAAMGQLGRVLALIENEYVDPVDRARLVDGAIAGMVHELDPHSSYYPPHDYKQELEETEGKFAGIGVEVELKDDAIVVLAPIENSPAEKAGLRSGDRIIAVDGHTIQDIGFDRLVKRMRGTPGTKVSLLVAREGRSDPLSIDVVRGEVQMTSVRGVLMQNAVAYVQVKQFQSKTHEELQRVAGRLRDESKAPLAGVLLDLRGNPGGLVDQAASVADEFMTAGTIYTMRHRGQVVEQATAHGGGAFANLPVVVLMNGFSASAAELVAGALQDGDSATVVGEGSWGKGSVQTMIDLPGGAGLKLTTGRYYTPGGHGVQGEGIHPDVTVEPSAKADAGAFSFHEKDFANALPSEGSTARDGGITVTYDAPDGGTVSEMLPAHDVPTDPRTGKDAVLRIGYETLLHKVKR
jgi:carboxyl-terminal processing protease